MRIYQTHDPETEGMSDSSLKLSRLRLPSDMSGMHVLDIGCNEGFFCRIAKERGAERVVGIDSAQERLDQAISLYGDLGIEFRHQSWDSLPDSTFDYIIWTSAMHYASDPKRIANLIFNALRADGTFILECGVADVHSMIPEMRYVVRHSDIRAYPTRSYLLNHILSDFAVRQVAAPEHTKGDPVARAVFHCNRAKSEIVLVHGPSRVGKSSFVHRHFAGVATKTIHLDYFISRLCKSKHAHREFLQFFQENYRPNNLGYLINAIDRHGLTETYIALVVGLLSPLDRLAVIEGFLTDLQLRELRKQTEADYILWEMSRCEVSAA